MIISFLSTDYLSKSEVNHWYIKRKRWMYSPTFVGSLPTTQLKIGAASTNRPSLYTAPAQKCGANKI